MKVGIIADTHDNMDAIREAVDVLNNEGVEKTIHAGDFVSPFTARAFKELKGGIIGVFGNNDGDKLLLKERYKGIGEIYEDPYEFEIGSKRIIVTHKPMIARSIALTKVYDIVIYGHTHEAEIEKKEGGALIINPGECCGWLTGKRTVAILDLEKEEARIISF
ncbi:MAG: metallophosphoesterase [Candidatus Methanospirareceae archaeon]